MATLEHAEMERIYREYGEKVFRYALSKLPSRHDAEDACSLVFLKVQKNFSKYDQSKASLSTWIYSIVHNVVVDFYRRTQVFEVLEDDIVCTDDDFEDIFNDETLEELAAALEVLPVKEYKIIILHYYSGKSLREIANTLQMSYSNAKVLHQKALTHLRILLKGISL